MPRPSILPVLLAIALTPLSLTADDGKIAPNHGGAPAASAPLPQKNPVTVPELTELYTAESPAKLRRLVEIAGILAAEIRDPEERAVTQGTLDAINSSPAEAEMLLRAHTVRLAEVRNKQPDIIFLTGLSELKTPEEIARYAQLTYAQLDKVGDPAIRLLLKLTLAKLEDNPQDAPAILKDHLKQLSTRFLLAAEACIAANDARGAINYAQIAVRCDPENIKARILFAHLLQTAMQDIPKATQTLAFGLQYLSPNAPETAPYLDRYFNLLKAREQDERVIEQCATLLAKDGFPAATRDMLAMHLAASLHYVGRNTEARDLVLKHNLTQNSQGCILLARTLFDSRRPEDATRVIESNSGNFRGYERDAMLGQLQRFHSELGKNRLALGIVDQRIREFPDRAMPYVHRLWILDRSGDAEQSQRELKNLFTNFAKDQSALLGIAEFASRRGNGPLSMECFRRAQSENFNRPLFALLALEAYANAREYRAVIRLYNDFIALDKTIFKGNEATAHAILSAAKFSLGDPIAKSEAERHLKEFLSTPNLTPDSYVSAARLLRRAESLEYAIRVLEAGRKEHPWNNQIRADLTAALILDGRTEAYGTRPSAADEIIAVAAGRKVHPKLWDTVRHWVESDATIPEPTAQKLRAIIAERSRPDLVRDESFE